MTLWSNATQTLLRKTVATEAHGALSCADLLNHANKWLDPEFKNVSSGRRAMAGVHQATTKYMRSLSMHSPSRTHAQAPRIRELRRFRMLSLQGRFKKIASLPRLHLVTSTQEMLVETTMCIILTHWTYTKRHTHVHLTRDHGTLVLQVGCAATCTVSRLEGGPCLPCLP